MKLPPFQLERYFAQWEFEAPYLLCCSDCESLTLQELLELEPDAEERLRSLRLGYTESLGAPSLRETITSLYEQIPAEGVLVHAGAEEAIFNFMNVALDAGDHLIVHAPCYQSQTEVARAIGVDVSEWIGDADNGWRLDLEHLQSLLTPRTRAVVVNFPHNPTGFLPDRAFLERLAELSRRHGFVVLSDEVYRGLEHDPDDRLPAFADLDDRAISLGVMSKTYGLAGLRLGWIATRNPELLREMAAFKDYTTICTAAPSELLSEIALRHHERLAERNRRIVLANLDLLDAFFARHQELFGWHRPKAGPIAFPALRRGSVEELCRDLVERAGVLLLPGSVYGEGYDAFRIGFGRRSLPEALARFDESLANSSLSVLSTTN